MQQAVVLSALAVVIFNILDPVAGECCALLAQANCTDLVEESQLCPFKCSDCSTPAPHCGLTTCNPFGCGCVAGEDGAACRAGNCTGPNLLSMDADDTTVIKTGADVVKTSDSDNDGVLCMKEALAYLSRMNMTLADVDMEEELNKLDLDKDGRFTADEIDPPTRNATGVGKEFTG